MKNSIDVCQDSQSSFLGTRTSIIPTGIHVTVRSTDWLSDEDYCDLNVVFELLKSTMGRSYQKICTGQKSTLPTMKERPGTVNDATVNCQMQYQNVVLALINSIPASLWTY